MKLGKEVGIRCALAIAAVGGLFTAFGAAAACYAPNSVPAGTATYEAIYPVDHNNTVCPPVAAEWFNGSLVYKYALTMNQAPSPASVICSDFSGGNYCEAWPQGPMISYGWRATGGVTLDYYPAPLDSSVILNCTGTATGVGRVTVYNPSGTSPQSAASVAYCGNQ